MEQYILEKSIWTQDDFEMMGWHDVRIYGMVIEKLEEAWQGNLIFDIDYIFKWVHPVAPQKYFSFWISPCTLIFKDVYDVKIDIDYRGGAFDLWEISDLDLISKYEQETGAIIYEWQMGLQEGNIRFKSLGFEQIVRKSPIYTNGLVLSLEERGGISFSNRKIDCTNF